MYDEAAAAKGLERLRQLLKMLQRFCGTSVVVEGIGARGKVQGSCKLEMHEYGPNTVWSNDGPCVPAAVSNACRYFYGGETAVHVKKYFDSNPTTFTTLK